MKFLKEVSVVTLLLIALLPALIIFYITLKLFAPVSSFLTHVKDELYEIHYTKQKLSEYQEHFLKKILEVCLHLSMLFWVCFVVYLTH